MIITEQNRRIFYRKITAFSGRAVLAAVIVAALSVPFSCWAAADKAPTLNLFPKDVAHYIKETGNNAKQLEDTLRDDVKGFDKQMALYKNSHCQEADSDPGCNEIKSRIEKHYRKILTTMDRHLPEIKSSINSASSSLEKRITKRIGREMSPRDIQRQLGDKKMPKIYDGRFSMSKRFSDYHKLIGRNDSSSLMVMASEIYLDTSSARDWIDLIESDIARQEVILNVFKMYGEVTPEMMNTLNAVKNVLFGEEIDNEEDVLPEASRQEEAESPWVVY